MSPALVQPVPTRQGQSDLGRACEVLAECLRVLPLESNLFEISFRAPELARLAHPGEFAQIWIDPKGAPLLRRPFSFSRADPGSGVVAFYVGEVGQGSRRLRRFTEGQRAPILGPLGQGFSLPPRPGRSLLVAGGLGAAPFPLLAQRLLNEGEELTWLNGARTESELYPNDLLPAGIAEQIHCTEDGSRGHPGLVTQGLAELLTRFDRVYACGPNRMLAEVWRLTRATGADGEAVSLEVSIEAPMGCGFGTCLACAIPLRQGGDGEGAELGLCCRQGPVLAGVELDWEALSRQPSHLQ